MAEISISMRMRAYSKTPTLAPSPQSSMSLTTMCRGANLQKRWGHVAIDRLKLVAKRALRKILAVAHHGLALFSAMKYTTQLGASRPPSSGA
jgi:hypothetical protein